jgi:hypothetical protein
MIPGHIDRPNLLLPQMSDNGPVWCVRVSQKVETIRIVRACVASRRLLSVNHYLLAVALALWKQWH